MEIFLNLTSILFTFFFNFQVDNIDRIGVKGPLTFNNSKFIISWTKIVNETYYIQEYLPKGEKIENFSEMLTVHLFTKDSSVNNAVAIKINELVLRKNVDNICNYQISNSPDSKESIVDFIISESKNNVINIVEFNIYRYKQIELNNSKALLVFSYTKRTYGKNINNFLNELSKIRIALLNSMIKFTIPKIILRKIK